MNSSLRSTEPFLSPQNDYYELNHESRPESRAARCLSPLLLRDPPTIGSSIFTAKLWMVWPFVVHFLGSVFIAPQIQLANGTYESQHLGKYHLLQSDVVTIVSVSLMVVRWAATAWAVPLCWRAIFLLAGSNGLRRRDIEWVVNYAILPLTTYHKRPLNLLIGLILIFTLAPSPSSPLLTGSISWLPSSLTVNLPYNPTIDFTGSLLNYSGAFAFVREYEATFSTDVVKNLNTAWTKGIEEGTFKRVIPSAARMDINSTIDNVLIPFFRITRIEWLPKMGDDATHLFDAMRRDQLSYPRLSEKMLHPGATTLIANFTHPNRSSFNPLVIPTSWSVLINVKKKLSLRDEHRGCDSTTTFLPENTKILSFYLELNATDRYDPRTSLFGCFAHANVFFDASLGPCHDCRISSYSTVQNTTEIYPITVADMPDLYYALVQRVLGDMPQYIPNMTPLKNSLPDPANGLETYVTALLTRLYSALWNSCIDTTAVWGRASSGYKPAVSTLRAEVSQARVYAWLVLQISFTLGGIAFIWLQSRSRYPLITDTERVAFDIDSTEVPVYKRGSSREHETDALLRVEPRGVGWKFVVAN